jgi:hypothetical protein
MDDEGGVQVHNLTTDRGGWLNAIWNKPLSAWTSAAVLIAQTAFELAVQTAALLITSAAITLQALAWHPTREPARR